jgi:hypothetical protein
MLPFDEHRPDIYVRYERCHLSPSRHPSLVVSGPERGKERTMVEIPKARSSSASAAALKRRARQATSSLAGSTSTPTTTPGCCAGTTSTPTSYARSSVEGRRRRARGTRRQPIAGFSPPARASGLAPVGQASDGKALKTPRPPHSPALRRFQKLPRRDLACSS